MIHSLEDKSRKELVEIVKIQQEEYQKLQKEVEKHKQWQENHYVLSCAIAFHSSIRDKTLEECEKLLAIRDLEQQAIGVEKAADVREINWTSGDRHTLHLLAKDLREKTKALRGESNGK
uniref:hypothetical protein n=1 Tax=Ningiella ruwaisensis TaxID=2364274 RepID=UPI00109F6CF7|nr:hypothetical protein [Ningiella ruwaisensis]